MVRIRPAKLISSGSSFPLCFKDLGFALSGNLGTCGNCLIRAHPR
jgi:hypothetical protein